MSTLPQQPLPFPTDPAQSDRTLAPRHYSIQVCTQPGFAVTAVVARMDLSTKRYTFVRLPDFEVPVTDLRHLNRVLEYLADEVAVDGETRSW